MYVYGLRDPRTGEIRYVGITGDIYKRYAQHLLYSNGEKLAWLGELKQEDVLPEFVILESGVDEASIHEREAYWIHYYLDTGQAPLVNSIIPKGRKIRNTSYFMIDEVARHLKLSERTVFRLIKSGELKGFKAGREWRFEEADIDGYIQRQRAKAGQSQRADDAA